MSTHTIAPDTWCQLPGVVQVMHSGPGLRTVTVHDGVITMSRGVDTTWMVRPTPADDLAVDPHASTQSGVLAGPTHLPALLFIDADGTLVSLAAETPPAESAWTDRRRYLVRALLDLATARVKWEELL